MFQMGNSVFCWFWKRIIVTAQLAFGIILFEILIISIVNIAMMLKKKKKRAPWNHLKMRIQRSPWQDMKQHTKYNDPARNHGVLSSFYQMFVITSINFIILPLTFYLD